MGLDRAARSGKVIMFVTSHRQDTQRPSLTRFRYVLSHHDRGELITLVQVERNPSSKMPLSWFSTIFQVNARLQLR